MISRDLDYLAKYVDCFSEKGMTYDYVIKLVERIKDIAERARETECMIVPPHLLLQRIASIQPQLTLHQGGQP